MEKGGGQRSDPVTGSNHHEHRSRQECADSSQTSPPVESRKDELPARSPSPECQQAAVDPSPESQHPAVDPSPPEGQRPAEASPEKQGSAPVKKFFCPCCNIGHATSEELIEHVRQFPIKLDTFSCSICLLEFFVKGDLIDHQRLDHQVRTHKTFACDECDLEYSSLNQLTRHKRMHQEIASKLAACGIFLPKPKLKPKPSNVQSESPAPDGRDNASTASVFPYRYSQSSSISADKHPPCASANGGNLNSVPETFRVEDGGAPSQMSEKDDETNSERNDDDKTTTTKKRKLAASRSFSPSSLKVVLKHRPGKSQCKGKTQSTEKLPSSTEKGPQGGESQSRLDTSTGVFMDVRSRGAGDNGVVDSGTSDSAGNDDVRDGEDGSEGRNVANKQRAGDDSDHDWQDYCASDFASDTGSGADDPDFRQLRRGRGRPKGSKNKTARQRGAKRKGGLVAKTTAGAGRQRKSKRRTLERGAKDSLETDERQETRREDMTVMMTVLKQPEKEEEEEVEIPAHLQNKDGSIQCPDCDVICYSLRGLNRHRNYHFRTMAVVSCVLCPGQFTSKQDMTTHMSQQHRQHHNKTSDPQSSGQQWECMEGQCGQVFSTAVALSRHRIRHHGVKRSQLHKCDQCGKVLPGSTELKNHKRIHTDERPFSCNLCSKTYRSSGGLLWHLKSHSQKNHDILNKFKDIKVTTDGAYVCELCGKEFKSVYGIRVHKENPLKKCSAMPGYCGKWKPKPAMCEVCGREFPSKVTLKGHMVTHTGDRPHKCRYCEATFRHYKNKFIHEKMHRNQKNFVCNVCGKAFYDGTNLKTHLASHKEVKDLPCQLCGKLFHVDVNRRRHEKRCRNFMRCPVCAAVFRQQERLSRHMAINHNHVVPTKADCDWLAAQPMPYYPQQRLSLTHSSTLASTTTTTHTATTTTTTTHHTATTINTTTTHHAASAGLGVRGVVGGVDNYVAAPASYSSSTTNFAESFSLFVGNQPQQHPSGSMSV